MFAEISAVIGILNTVNSAISTLKESRANAQDAASLLGKFGDATNKLNQWEKKTKLKRPLTAKEAMDLTLARRKIEQVDRELKDACLMMGCADVYNEMKRVQYESEQAHKKYMRGIEIKRRKRRKAFEQYMTAFGIVIILVAFCAISYGGYRAYLNYKISTTKDRLELIKEQKRNMRKCGRVEC